MKDFTVNLYALRPDGKVSRMDSVVVCATCRFSGREEVYRVLRAKGFRVRLVSHTAKGGFVAYVW